MSTNDLMQSVMFAMYTNDITNMCLWLTDDTEEYYLETLFKEIMWNTSMKYVFQ